MKLRGLNPRNSYVTIARQPRSEELFVLVAGDYGVIEYSVGQQQMEKKRELGNTRKEKKKLPFLFLLT